MHVNPIETPAPIGTFNDDESEALSPWLLQALHIHHAETLWQELADPETAEGEAFLSRCEKAAEAANVALSMARLREESRRVGFTPLPFAAYLESLAAGASVPLDPILHWAKVESLSRLQEITTDTALAVGRIARELGFNLRQALLYVNIGYAECQGRGGAVWQTSYLGGGNSPQVADYESTLAVIRREYTEEQIKTLLDIEQRIQKVYNAPETGV